MQARGQDENRFSRPGERLKREHFRAVINRAARADKRS
jgi:hypothetical protein